MDFHLKEGINVGGAREGTSGLPTRASVLCSVRRVAGIFHS